MNDYLKFWRPLHEVSIWPYFCWSCLNHIDFFTYMRGLRGGSKKRCHWANDDGVVSGTIGEPIFPSHWRCSKEYAPFWIWALMPASKIYSVGSIDWASSCDVVVVVVVGGLRKMLTLVRREGWFSMFKMWIMDLLKVVGIISLSWYFQLDCVAIWVK